MPTGTYEPHTGELNKFQKFNHNASANDGHHLNDIADQCDKLCDKLEIQGKRFSANFEISVPKRAN